MSKVIWRDGKIGVSFLFVLLFFGVVFCPCGIVFAEEAVSVSDLRPRAQDIQSLIKAGDIATAEAELVKLTNDFSGDAELAKAVNWAANAYERNGHKAKTAELRQMVIDGWPGSFEAMAASVRMAIASIGDSNGISASSVVEKLYTDYGAIDEFDKVVYGVARQYNKRDLLRKARVLFQMIVDKYPEKPTALGATKELAFVAIKAGNEQAARDHCKSMVDNYLDNPGVTKRLMLIGEAYFKKALLGESTIAVSDPNSVHGPELYFSRTIEICEYILEEMPALPKEKLVVETHEMLAISYGRLGMYGSAAEHYTTILEIWPEYEKGWHIRYMVGNCYQQMKKAKAMAADEADGKTRVAYEQLIAEYPNCKVAKAVNNWLGRN